MLRKFACAMVAMSLAIGSVFAEEVKGTFVKFAEGTLTLKVGDAEKDYKIPADLKIKRKGRDGKETESAASESLERMSKSKFKPTVVLTVEEEKVSGVKFEFGKGKGTGKGKGKAKAKDKE